MNWSRQRDAATTSTTLLLLISNASQTERHEAKESHELLWEAGRGKVEFWEQACWNAIERVQVPALGPENTTVQVEGNIKLDQGDSEL